MMRGKRLWVALPPTVMCIPAGAVAFWYWDRARQPFSSIPLEVWGPDQRPLYTLFTWVLGDPFSLVAATILWLFCVGSFVVRLPAQVAKTLSLALSLGFAAVVAFGLNKFLLLSVGVAAMTVYCWERSDAAGNGGSDDWLRRIAVTLAGVLLADFAAALALHVYGNYRFDRAVAEMETFRGTRLDVDAARFHRPPPPGHDNAMRRFLAAAEAVDLSQEERSNLATVAALPLNAWPPWEVNREEEAESSDPGVDGPAMAERLRIVMAKNRRGLELLHQAAERRCLSYPLSYRNNYREPDVSNVTLALTTARVLSAECRLAFDQGNEARGLRAARTLARLGSCFDQQHHPAFHLVAIAIENQLNHLAIETASSSASWATRPSLLSGLAAVLPKDRSANIEDTLLVDALESSLAARYGWRTIPWRDASPVPAFVMGPLEGSQILSGQLFVMKFARLPLGTFFEKWLSSPDRFAGTTRFAFDVLLKSRLVASQAQLTRAALSLRRLGLPDGTYPRRRPNLPELTRNEPAAGRLLTYRLLEDGSLRLEAEGAAKLWKRAFFRYGLRFTFRVTLPPPDQPDIGK